MDIKRNSKVLVACALACLLLMPAAVRADDDDEGGGSRRETRLALIAERREAREAARAARKAAQAARRQARLDKKNGGSSSGSGGSSGGSNVCAQCHRDGRSGSLPPGHRSIGGTTGGGSTGGSSGGSTVCAQCHSDGRSGSLPPGHRSIGGSTGGGSTGGGTGGTGSGGSAVCAQCHSDGRSGSTPPGHPSIGGGTGGGAGGVGSHAGRFTTYEGAKTCLPCHEEQAREVHASAHYQWKGSTPDLANWNSGAAGKLGGINDFCIYPDINWIGLLTNVDGVEVDGGCSKCHTGMGEKPTAQVTAAQLENIDCLLCHSETYQRKVVRFNGGFRWVPAPERMSVSLIDSATSVKMPDRDACLNCHTKAGGGNNYKRGDIEEAHRDPSASFDVHMASNAKGGAGLVCTSCHTVQNHRIAGRGSDLRETDLAVKVDCLRCHGSAPHDSADLNRHTARVNCTVCHIPAYAKIAPTDMVRDWSRPAELDNAKRLYDPHMTMESNVVPEYRFWNGKSTMYQFGEPAVANSEGMVVMSEPVGSVTTAGAKIYAFKRHSGIQPIDSNDRLMPLKIGLFFQTGDVDTAVVEGAKAVGWGYTGHDFARTERWMGLFHEVAPASQALTCNNCHNGGTRLPLVKLGYAPLPTRNSRPLCASCHSDESGAWTSSQRFSQVHDKHVNDEGLNCSNCHAFSKATQTGTAATTTTPRTPTGGTTGGTTSNASTCARCHSDGRSGSLPPGHRAI